MDTSIHLYTKQDVLTILVAAGADIESETGYGMTMLMNASINGRIDVVELLIKAGVNLNARSCSGCTALMYAFFCGYKNIARLLLAAKADPNMRDKDGKTMIRHGSCSRTEILEILQEFAE